MPPPPLFSNIDTSPPPLPSDSVYTSCYCEENIYLLAQAFTQLSDADSTADDRGPWPWQIYVVFISNGGKTVALWSQKTPSGVVVWDYHVVLVLLPRTPLDPGSDGAPTPESDSQGTAERHAWVYDFDTTLPVPCSWIDYIAGTFPYAAARARSCVDERFHSVFRVIRADVYLDHFASDRSHMITPALTTDVETQRPSGGASEGRGRIDEAPEVAEEGPRYASPPPGYPPICGAKARALGITDNLMRSFVAMDALPAPLAEEPVTRREGEDEGSGSMGSEAVRYGQVTDMVGFLNWLAGSPDAGREEREDMCWTERVRGVCR
ncbi:uncharacterized protein TRAVEDRAFT_71054 [Trametes versicolor FP-101664 SS1]|uniref:uncharacterized protein n=1 Tax=Trametes versicolor (strain FP-101664) TaxID=717944 RepID=UPI00046219B3|nr:uncharacterized protein TRAVEDRAFT_71054 [Trametes versicolor FP-101664 SS1]EIW60754.1 hypothetical protein TRAVEDRAFT_71054 [Trametes versicolor FP-101664 SS1]